MADLPNLSRRNFFGVAAVAPAAAALAAKGAFAPVAKATTLSLKLETIGACEFASLWQPMPTTGLLHIVDEPYRRINWNAVSAAADRLPNPFMDSAPSPADTTAVTSAPNSSPVTAVTHSPREVSSAVAPGMAHLESQAKATEGKAGMAEGHDVLVRRSTAGAGLLVGVADAARPATSEIMDVTAGETALNSDDLEIPAFLKRNADNSFPSAK